jgi:hypothetical protein
MQESHTSAISAIDVKRAPLHEEIARCARDKWVQSGKPADRDLIIWLEAEQRLLSATKVPENSRTAPSSRPQPIKLSKKMPQAAKPRK